MAAEGGRRERLGDGRPFASASWRTTSSAYDWYYNVVEPDAVVPAALPMGPASRAAARRAVPASLGRGLRGRERRLRGRRPRGARGGARRRRVLPRLPPLPRAAARARSGARGDAHALRAHPVGSRTTGGCSPNRSACRSTMGCSRTTPSRSTRHAGGATSAAARHPGRAFSAGRARARASRPDDARRRVTDLGRCRRVRGAGRGATPY